MYSWSPPPRWNTISSVTVSDVFLVSSSQVEHHLQCDSVSSVMYSWSPPPRWNTISSVTVSDVFLPFLGLYHVGTFLVSGALKRTSRKLLVPRGPEQTGSSQQGSAKFTVTEIATPTVGMSEKY